VFHLAQCSSLLLGAGAAPSTARQQPLLGAGVSSGTVQQSLLGAGAAPSTAHQQPLLGTGAAPSIEQPLLGTGAAPSTVKQPPSRSRCCTLHNVAASNTTVLLLNPAVTASAAHLVK
jgi:hypothetical protein